MLRFLAQILAFLTISGAALAQDAARPSSQPTPAVNHGVVCNTAIGEVASLTATGTIQCTNWVANVLSATTATTATTSTTANALAVTSSVNANQISGTPSASQLGIPACATGEVIQFDGTNFVCIIVASGMPSCPEDYRMVFTNATDGSAGVVCQVYYTYSWQAWSACSPTIACSPTDVTQPGTQTRTCRRDQDGAAALTSKCAGGAAAATQACTYQCGCTQVTQAAALTGNAFFHYGHYGDHWGWGWSGWHGDNPAYNSFYVKWKPITMNQTIPNGLPGTYTTVAVRITPESFSDNGHYTIQGTAPWCWRQDFNMRLYCEPSTRRWRVPQEIQGYVGSFSGGCSGLSETTPSQFWSEYDIYHAGYAMLSSWGTTSYFSP